MLILHNLQYAHIKYKLGIDLFIYMLVILN